MFRGCYAACRNVNIVFRRGEFIGYAGFPEVSAIRREVARRYFLR